MKTLLTLLGVVFLLLPGMVHAQSVKGSVKDSKGEALIGVNISIKNTAKGVVSDFDGNYEIKATSDETLIFSYMGFVAQEVKVNNRTVIDVVLQDGSQNLDEVVVTAIGIKQSSDTQLNR